MALDVSLPAAAAAGLLSFLSPCVLPLVPPYLCFLAGTSVEELGAGDKRAARREVALASLLFVAGFSTVFIALGASATALGSMLRAHERAIGALAGAAIVAMGLHFLGLFRIGLLYREKRLTVAARPGVAAAYAMGAAFAVGWTPCIGPILGAILSVAGSEATVLRGAGLLAVYSAGLGVPFVLAALFMPRFIAFSRGFRAHLGKVEKVAGALLVATGIAFMAGGMQAASGWLLATFPGLQALAL